MPRLGRNWVEAGLTPVSPTLAFDVSGHDAARTAVAKSMLTRMRDDVGVHAQMANSSAMPKMRGLEDATVHSFFYEADDNAAEAGEGGGVGYGASVQDSGPPRCAYGYACGVGRGTGKDLCKGRACARAGAKTKARARTGARFIHV